MTEASMNLYKAIEEGPASWNPYRGNGSIGAKMQVAFTTRRLLDVWRLEITG